MRVWTWSLCGLWLAALAGCDQPALKGGGEPCRSLSDCAPGYACVAGACSTDLEGLAEQNEPPPFTTIEEPPEDAGMDGAVDTEPDDAGPDGG